MILSSSTIICFKRLLFSSKSFISFVLFSVVEIGISFVSFILFASGVRMCFTGIVSLISFILISALEFVSRSVSSRSKVSSLSRFIFFVELR